MSASFSYAQVGGTLGRDPEVRATGTGKKVVSFSLAVEKGYGESKSTHWFNCVCWGQPAEFAEKYLKKGKSVAVSGDLEIRSWDDKQTGQKRTVTEINAKSIQFLDSGRGGSESGNRQESSGRTRQAASPQPRQAAAPEQDDPFADEIPF